MTTRTIYVDKRNGDDRNDGLSKRTAVRNLNRGFVLAGMNGLVRVIDPPLNPIATKPRGLVNVQE